MFRKLLQRFWAPSGINTTVEALVRELVRRYPPSMASGEGRRLSPQAVTNILEAVIGKAVAKSQELELGVVGKARLSNNFKWALKEQGYPEAFIDLVTEALVVYMTRAAKG
ncbi:MAG: hypothetical protein RIS90_3086 [Pseudomonadota bacterium]|jgi:hypothetical protein